MGISPFTCLVTWIRFSSSPAPTLALTLDGISPRVRRQALSRIHGTSVSCRIIGLGVFFVLSPLAAGPRVVMLSHGASRALADRFMIAGAVTAGVIATAIMLGMCGLRLQFA